MDVMLQTTGPGLAPFGDRPADLPVLGSTLRASQDQAVAEAGLRWAAGPAQGPHIVLSDRTWVTADLLRRVAQGPAGRLRVAHEAWLRATGSLQAEPGLYEVARVEGPFDGRWEALPAVDLDLPFTEHPALDLHPAFAHAGRPIVTGPALVHPITHWSHLLRVNHLALADRGAREAQRFQDAPVWTRLWRGLGAVLRAGGTNPFALARAVSSVHPSAKVHPTATVELSDVGEGVEIGPYAVVRGSVLAARSRVDEYASLNLSVVGEGARVGRYALVNLCVLMAGSQVSTGGGFQVSLFGRDAFVGTGVTMHDLSFGRPIRSDGVDTGLHFLGGCVGHRARLLNGARLAYGVSVPNDAFVVGPAFDLLRDWSGAPVGEPVRVENGRAVPVRRQ